MITPSSLAAFSPVQPAPRATPVAATSPARAPDTAPKVLQSLPQGASGGTPPTRNTPRGSLLDLSV